MHDSDPDAWFIFNLHREPFLSCTHKQIMDGCVFLRIKKERNTLTWKGSPLFIVANSHPLRSLTSNQLPLCPLPFPHPPAPASRKKDIYLHTYDINMPATPFGHTKGDNKSNFVFLEMVLVTGRHPLVYLMCIYFNLHTQATWNIHLG
jgi:hypothetical protein